MKEICVDFSDEAYTAYTELQNQVVREQEEGKENSFNIQLLKSIEREKTNLKINPQIGDHIPRKVISKGVAQRYGTDRLWRLELVGYWRLIYTVVGDEVKIVSFVLEFMDHKTYDKVFGYRKR